VNLRKKKNLAAKTLGIGKGRIVFLQPRLEEIKNAITKQDIKDLKKEGAIVIKEIKGRKKVKKAGKKRGSGKIKKKVNKRKQNYVIMTRKLRRYISELKKQGRILDEEVKEIRKKIRNKKFKSKAHLKEQIKTRKE